MVRSNDLTPRKAVGTLCSQPEGCEFESYCLASDFLQNLIRNALR